jgi:hypothetical protein
MVAVQPQSVVMQENAVPTHLRSAAGQGRRRQGRGGDRQHGGWSSGRDGADGCCRQQVRAGPIRTDPSADWTFLGPIAASRSWAWNAPTQPEQTRPPKPNVPPAPESAAWTRQDRPAGQPAGDELLDQSWLSPALANGQAGALVDRRTSQSG